MQANRKFIYVREKAPVYKLFCNKAPKTQQVEGANLREGPMDIFMVPNGRRH